jgi:hypothetical protein
MARRARSQEEYQGPGAGRRPRRKRGNEGLYLALGGAGVVAIVLVIMISGGSGGTAEIKAASETLEDFMDAVLKDQMKRAMGMASIEGLLVDHDPVALKERTTLTPEQWKKIEGDIWHELKDKVKNQLRLESKIDVQRKVLDKAEKSWDSYQDWVQFRWKSEGYETVVAERRFYVKPEPWLARLREIDGTWRVVKLAKER